jgi:predicted Fe-Mo cluster-binding NifX family protein
MKICIPTQEDKGLAGIAYGHFGSAQYFIIHDTESGETKSLSNGNQHHAHGACNPMAALDGANVEAVIVGGIGRRAVMGLNEQGIKVYLSIDGTAQDNVDALKQGKLDELTADNACGGHGHGAGCGH